MRPERSETLHKQTEVSLDREQFWLVIAAYEPERLVKFPASIQGHFIRLTKSRVI